VFCGRHLLAAKLRPANIDAAAGTVEEIARIAAQIRRCWPHTRIILRGDSGFARDGLMGWCEANGVDYIFGLARNGRLKGMIAAELWRSATGEPTNRQAGAPIQGLHLVDPQELEPRAARHCQGRVEGSTPSGLETAGVMSRSRPLREGWMRLRERARIGAALTRCAPCPVRS
jgi:hypothetical protein